MRFGKTKGEIRVEKGDIFGVIWGVLRGLDLVWESATPPTHIWEKSFFSFFFFFGGGGSPNTSYGIILLFGVWHLQSGGSVGSSKKSGPNEKWGGVCLE